MQLLKLFIYTTSPTYLYADYKKKTLNEKEKKNFISKKNKQYLFFSLVTFLVFLFFNIFSQIQVNNNINNYIKPILFILFISYFSRVSEIFYSFLYDVLEKLNSSYKFSFFNFKERIKLAFNSYIELIVNYTLMYWIIYSNFGLFNKDNLSLINLLYYSCVTITTLGYGDIFSSNEFVQLLSVYEVFNGMLLVIVCFTIYISLNYNKELHDKIERFKISYVADISKIEQENKTFKSKNKLTLILSLIIIACIFIFGFIIISSFYKTNILLSLIIYISFIVLLLLILKK